MVTKVFLTGGSGFVGRNLIRYLKNKSIPVVALVRSETAEKTVRDAGAESIRGDLDNKDAMIKGMQGCDTVIHAAALVNGPGATWNDFYTTTVLGTRHVLDAAIEVDSVTRFVHIGSESALCTNIPLVNIDETYPLPSEAIGNYPRSKNMSERIVREANNSKKPNDKLLETIVVRPRCIWGGDDTVLMPEIKKQIESGAFKWVNGGHHKTSSVHIDNMCEGTYLAAEKGRAGEVYFILDDGPVKFRQIIEDAMQALDVDTSKIGDMPGWMLWSMVWVMENIVSWFTTPALDSFQATIATCDCVLNDDKARRELGYKPVISYEEGMKDLAERYKNKK